MRSYAWCGGRRESLTQTRRSELYHNKEHQQIRIKVESAKHNKPDGGKKERMRKAN